MPIPLLLGAAAISAAGGAANAFAQGKMNKKSMEFSREMYQTQKADNLAFWNMQNEYNSPEAQMQRFTDAGLNPNLIYGQSNASGPISTPDVQKPQFESTRPGDIVPAVLSGIDLVTNLEMKQAQTDNIKAQNDVIRQQAILMGSQISNTEASTKQRLLDYNFRNELFATDVEARKEQLRKLRNDIDISTNQDLRAAVQQSSNLKEAEQRILSAIQSRSYQRQQMAQSKAEVQRIKTDTDRIIEQIQLMRKDGQMKDLDVWLSKQGIRAGDPIWYRAIASVFDTMINSFK